MGRTTTRIAAACTLAAMLWVPVTSIPASPASSAMGPPATAALLAQREPPPTTLPLPPEAVSATEQRVRRVTFGLVGIAAVTAVLAGAFAVHTSPRRRVRAAARAAEVDARAGEAGRERSGKG